MTALPPAATCHGHKSPQARGCMHVHKAPERACAFHGALSQRAGRRRKRYCAVLGPFERPTRTSGRTRGEHMRATHLLHLAHQVFGHLLPLRRRHHLKHFAHLLFEGFGVAEHVRHLGVRVHQALEHWIIHERCRVEAAATSLHRL